MTGLLTIAGCGDSKSGETTTTVEGVDLSGATFVDKVGQRTVDVKSVDNAFEDRYITVEVGTKVVWTNTGRNDHNITPSVDGAFKGVLQASFHTGMTHEVVFTAPGDYPYYCTLHGTKKNGQNGAVRVVAKK